MKKPVLIFLAAALLLLLTNPSVSAHREKIKEQLHERVRSSEKGREAVAYLSPAYTNAYFDKSVEDEVSVDNYYLFSITKINYAATDYKLERRVGVLGNVFLWSGM